MRKTTVDKLLEKVELSKDMDTLMDRLNTLFNWYFSRKKRIPNHITNKCIKIVENFSLL